MTDNTTPSAEGKTVAAYLETEGLAKARELIAKGGEEQLNRAVYILKHIPERASDSTLIMANAKLGELASIKEKERKAIEKRRKRRIAAILALAVAVVCAPFAIGAIGDQVALSGRLKSDASENPVEISYDGRYWESLCETTIAEALDGEELLANELELLLEDNYDGHKDTSDAIFKTIFPSVYDEANEKDGGKGCYVYYLTTSNKNNGIKKLAVENNKYSLQVTGTLMTPGFTDLGQITYTLDLYFGVPSKDKVTVANAKVTSLTWE